MSNIKAKCVYCDGMTLPNLDKETCSGCNAKYGYFELSEYLNKVKQERLAAERKKANENVVRSYRLKKK